MFIILRRTLPTTIHRAFWTPIKVPNTETSEVLDDETGPEYGAGFYRYARLGIEVTLQRLQHRAVLCCFIHREAAQIYFRGFGRRMTHRLGDECKRCAVIHQGRSERMPGGLGGQSRNAQLLTDTL